MIDHIKTNHADKVSEEYALLYLRIVMQIEELSKNFMNGDLDVQLDEATENIANYTVLRTLRRLLKKE